MINSILRSSGDKITVSINKPIWVQGAWNLGPIIETKEIETAGFSPGMFVDPVAVAAGGEDNCTIGASASVVALGIAEIDYGQLNVNTDAYSIADEAPIIFFHWNPGALLQHIWIVDPTTNLEPGTLLGTTSTVAGELDDDTTTMVCMRSYKYVTDPAGTGYVAAFIHGYL